jgi:hypothetical protein
VEEGLEPQKSLAAEAEVESVCLEPLLSFSEAVEVGSTFFLVNRYLRTSTLPGQMLTRINLTFS